MDPLVSVIIPAHNSGPHLAATVQSVLAQAHRPLQVVVVDDGSTDATAEMVAGFGPPVELIRKSRSGHPAARNTGIQAARGEYLAFVDHDDLWSESKLALQLECFRREPGLDLVFGHIRNFFSEELSQEEQARIKAPMASLPGLLQGSMLARRSVFERVGEFDPEREIGDFIDWYGRALMAGLEMRMLPDVVLYRRIHRANHQRQNRHRLREGYLRAVKDLLERRRLADRA